MNVNLAWKGGEFSAVDGHVRHTETGKGAAHQILWHSFRLPPVALTEKPLA